MAEPNFLFAAVRPFKALFKADAFEGILLIAVAIIAMIVANSGVYHAYHELFEGSLFGEDFWRGIPGNFDKLMVLDNLHGWINDGLMVIFFFVVGLEVKRELIVGNLSDPQQRNLPVIAAIAGMAIPILVFLGVTGGDAEYRAGMAIPAATDIAFAMGVIGLLGSRVPKALRLFLLTVAIVDDIGAVAIIAIFYSDPKMMWLLFSLIVLIGMFGMNRFGVSRMWPFVIATVILWYCVLNSGVHATIAGVLAAFTIPMRTKDGNSMVEDAEHALVPWSAYLVVPIFGFANAGVSLEGIGLGNLLDPLPLAVAAGLIVGKQVGIFGAVWGAVKLGIVTKPEGSSWPEIWGVSVLCGIGFTMSLFIGELAFPGSALLRDEAKIGILMGSLVSAVLGYLILRMTTTHPDALVDDPSDPVV